MFISEQYNFGWSRPYEQAYFDIYTPFIGYCPFVWDCL